MTTGSGYIKIHRSILDWEWWGDINVFRLWMTILMMANWKDKEWRGQTIKRGSFVTSYPSLADATGLTVQQTRTAIEKLKSTGEIKQVVTNKYQLIIVVNYEKYQDLLTDDNRQITDKQQTNNSQITDNLTVNQHQLNKYKNINKGNKGKKRGRFAPPSLSEVRDYISEKGYRVDAEQFISFYESKNWMVGKNKMKDWKASVRTWERRINDQEQKKPQQQGSRKALFARLYEEHKDDI